MMKEQNELTIEIRNLRNQKVDLEKEKNQTFNSTMTLKKEVTKIKTSIKKLIEENLSLTQANQNLRLETKEEVARLNKARNDAEVTIEQAEEKIDAVTDAELELNKNRATHLKNVANLDQKSARLRDERKDLQDRLKEADKLIEKRKEINVKESKALVSIEASRKVYEEKQANAIKLADESKVLKETLKHKICEADAVKINLKAKESALASDTAKVKKNVEASAKELVVQKQITSGLNAKEHGLDKVSESLEQEKKRVEILHLKLEKLAYDKGLDEELKVLKKDIKK